MAGILQFSYPEPKVRPLWPSFAAPQPVVNSFAGTILYIGGQPSSLPSLRDAVTSTGARFLHHDGGQADAMSLLAGLVGRADMAVFPADCVSHNAANAVKRLCKQSEKPFVALPRSGVGSLLRVLSQISPADDVEPERAAVAMQS